MRKVFVLLSAVLTLADGTLLPRQASAFCFEQTGRMYGVAPGLLAVVAEHESGLDALAHNENADGSYDIGLMQINSSWKEVLGIKRWEAVHTDPCYNVVVGASILAHCLRRFGYSWEGLGCYNATSVEKRAAYASAIIRKMWRRREGTQRLDGR